MQWYENTINNLIAGKSYSHIIIIAIVTFISRHTFLPAVEAVLCDHSAAELLVILIDPCADHSDGSFPAGKAQIHDRADRAQLFDMIMKVQLIFNPFRLIFRLVLSADR